MNKWSRPLSVLFLFVALSFGLSQVRAQFHIEIKSPDGEILKGVTGNETPIGPEFPIGYTGNGIYFWDKTLSSNGTIWNPPAGSTIQGVGLKYGGGGDLIILVQPAGSTNSADVYRATFTGLGWDTPVKQGSVVSSNYSESLLKLIGDALYVRGSSYIYVSRNVGVTWSVDTLGLTGAFTSDITMDTTQHVWAATSKGLFRQAPDTSLWVRVDSLKVASASTVFGDRRNRVYVSTNQGVYYSTDQGLSWTFDTTGIGTASITSWGDDRSGNIYAVSSLNTLFKSPGGTGSWTSLQAGIVAVTVTTPGLVGVAGDTTLLLATSFGLLVSTNQGTTWQMANKNIPASVFGGFVKSSSGKWFTSTNLALYSKNPADTSWTQVYPANGFKSGLPIVSDGSGTLYTASGTTAKGGPLVYKSVNNGTTWTADTLGASILRTGVFFIDENGMQHLATSQYGSSFPTLIFTKPVGSGWTLDTAGFQSTNYSYTSSMTSDKHGSLYVSGYYFNGATQVNAKVMKRPLAGGTWVPDTSGIPPSVNYFSQMGTDKNGNIFAVAGSSLYRHTGSTWSTVPLPSPVTTNFYSPGKFSFDSSGALFVSFTNFQGGRGVYFTSDSGTTWTYAGLDSIYVNKLISYGDSTFATTDAGLYILTRQGAATGIAGSGAVPAAYALFQNYPNPFNPTTTITFSIAKFSIVNLKIYDLLGREVATLANGAMSAGLHEVTFDASKLASGVYFYQLRAGDFVSTRKLLLLK
ncbi:MAG TPA: T9SS type A sorting domain-containing protein [Bacteroidota bacterium]